jgi:hypothetical protein
MSGWEIDDMLFRWLGGVQLTPEMKKALRETVRIMINDYLLSATTIHNALAPIIEVLKEEGLPQ